MLADDDELAPQTAAALTGEMCVGRPPARRSEPGDRRREGGPTARAVPDRGRGPLRTGRRGRRSRSALSDVARRHARRPASRLRRRAIATERHSAAADPDRDSSPWAGSVAREMSYGSDADVLFVHEPSRMRRGGRARLRLRGGRTSCDGCSPCQAPTRRSSWTPTFGRRAAKARWSVPSRRTPPTTQRWSKVWEAQALLRACPHRRRRSARRAVHRLIDPLRYPAGGLAASDVSEIRRIKARVDAERLPRGADPATHLKLGRGGLADVEWTVQLLQMRFGHAHPGLRTTQTLPALSSAVTEGLVTSDQADALAAAWRLASRIRNALMLVRGRPSDSLPSQARDRVGVAFLCGYGSDGASRLFDDYQRTARRASAVVREVFWS